MTFVKKPLLSLESAQQQMKAHLLNWVPPTEWITLQQADGRVLAQAITSSLNVPSFDNSAMDGYALRLADWSLYENERVFPISQRIAAGEVAQPLTSGTCARIFTGAPLPAGADAIIIQEETILLENNQVKCIKRPHLGAWIRSCGDDVAQGSVILDKGCRLTPAGLGLLASIGQAHVKVVKRPKVALFATGSELIMPGSISPERLPQGAIFNSNRFVLHALLERWGCEITDGGILPDDLQATQIALAQAAQKHDLIITSGGVSVGEADFVKPALQALGTLDLWQIAMKPGKPFAFGKIPNQTHVCYAMGLPGNPVSSLITCLLLVRPFLQSWLGQLDEGLRPWLLRADFDWLVPDRRREFVRVRRNDQGGVDVFPNQSSGVLTSAVWADGVVDIAADTTFKRGQMVSYLPLFETWKGI